MPRHPTRFDACFAWLGVALALLLPSAIGASERVTPHPDDIAVVREFVETDRAYAPAARAEARKRVARLGSTTSPARFELEVAHIAALADNGHSVVFPPQWTTRYGRSPVRLGLFADGLFVIAAPDRFASVRGQRVLEINGVPWQRIRNAYTRYQGGEQAFRDQFVPLFMEMPALLQAAGFGTDADVLTLQVGDSRRRSRRIEVRAEPAPYAGDEMLVGRPMLLDAAAMLPEAKRPLYLQAADAPFRLAMIEDIDAAYVQLKKTSGEALPAFLEATLATLRERRPRHLIVDLRFNIGGDLTKARDFMVALPGIVPTGRVFAITSGRTFSAGISSLGYLRQAAGGRLAIVGEPIGDRLEFWAEGKLLTLPHAGTVMLNAVERHNYRTGCPEEDCHRHVRTHPIRVAGLQPDLATSLRFADFVAGRDPALEAIRRQLQPQARHAADR